jgi:hypothetical protein
MANQLTFDFSAQPDRKDRPALNLDDVREKTLQHYRFERFKRVRKEKENSQKIQIAETKQLNEDFEINQEELFNRFALLLDDVFMARIEEKLIFKDELSPKEIDFANENFWIPEGFKFDSFGLKPLNT